MTDNKKNISIKFLQHEGYNRTKIVENKSKGYVMNGKKPTEYYDYVIDRYNGSPTNAVIINSYVNMMYGNGLMPAFQNYNVEEWVKVKQILKGKDVRALILDNKILGESSWHVIENGKKDLDSINHIAKNKILPAIADEDNNINSYFFSNNWSDVYKNPPDEIEAFDFTKKQRESIYNIKPYSIGNEYFRDPDYKAGLVYAEMEEEISNFYINHIRNGLSFGYIINIPNGTILTEEEQNQIEQDIKTKLTGTNNAGKFVLAFGDGDEKITVEALEVNSAHKQWEYLTKESRQQILTAHGVTSPMLFGVKDNTGLGNNANELIEAKKLYMDTVIRPARLPIIESIEDILLKYGIGIRLKFADTEIQESKVELSEKKNPVDNLGEVIDLKEWDLIDQIEVDYEEEDKLFKKIELASTGTARPNAKSSQDGENYLVRYKYVGNKNPQREFCSKMMKSNKVYRKEDIIQMGNQVVNAGWGAKGSDKYSIWLYKGGGNCHHKWNRVIYLKKGSNPDINSPLIEIISTSEARRKGYKLETNDSLVSIEPRNMENNGFLKNI